MSNDSKAQQHSSEALMTSESDEEISIEEIKPLSQQTSQSTNTLENFVMKTSKSKREYLTELFFIAVISGGIALKWVENPYLIKFFNQFQSVFKLPTNYQIYQCKQL